MKIEIVMNLTITARPKDGHYEDLNIGEDYPVKMINMGQSSTSVLLEEERVYTLREMDYDPYIMIYNKQLTKGNEPVRLLQRYVNNRKIFKTIKKFEDYNPKMG